MSVRDKPLQSAADKKNRADFSLTERVYLTRPVERLEAAGCSFVSVTQAFNTSSSMGRLTLNVLLSFAQFEREVTAERIRDKIAASKKKGLWMGGVCPLGYDPHPDRTRRELVVNETEAAVVRQLFDLYRQNGCLNAVVHEAARRGLRSKRIRFSTGPEKGGKRMSQGQIHRLLTNPVYLGRIRHKEESYSGTHPAIIDEELWAEVQMRLQSASARRRGARPGAPVEKGKFRDDTGDILTPTHTTRAGKRLRYYVSNRLITGGTDSAGWQIPAPTFDTAVAEAIASHLADHAKRHTALVSADAHPAASASTLLQALATRIGHDGIAAAVPLIREGRLASGQLRIDLDATALSTASGVAAAVAPQLLQIERPFHCRRRGVELKIVAGETKNEPDPVLLRALQNAGDWAQKLRAGTTLQELARAEGTAERYMSRIIRTGRGSTSQATEMLQEICLCWGQPRLASGRFSVNRPVTGNRPKIAPRIQPA